ncbi:hypothetical protein FA95DRAFT_1574686 [Auriscalpium vulgare]|uniref:Uncharacterized protein n=1 Tax=Auriscalpium vulgare TaxID=40419 RepID=A0ACB8RIY3_9AGAM|nr:hypothetical protein FA95DRAFT_1574686 [Auriscalpium vulgare]
MPASTNLPPPLDVSAADTSCVSRGAALTANKEEDPFTYHPLRAVCHEYRCGVCSNAQCEQLLDAQCTTNAEVGSSQLLPEAPKQTTRNLDSNSPASTSNQHRRFAKMAQNAEILEWTMRGVENGCAGSIPTPTEKRNFAEAASLDALVDNEALRIKRHRNDASDGSAIDVAQAADVNAAMSCSQPAGRYSGGDTETDAVTAGHSGDDERNLETAATFSAASCSPQMSHGPSPSRFYETFDQLGQAAVELVQRDDSASHSHWLDVLGELRRQTDETTRKICEVEQMVDEVKRLVDETRQRIDEDQRRLDENQRRLDENQRKLDTIGTSVRQLQRCCGQRSKF